MERKKFITTALMAIPGITFAGGIGLLSPKKQSQKSDKKGFILKANESRYHGHPTTPGNAFLHCKISTTDTDEKLLIQTSTPKVFEHAGGPPPHIHGNEDEIIYIVSGAFIVHIEGEDYPVKSGDTAFIPKGTLHTVINPIDNNPGTLMTIFQPAPQKVEDFFSYIAEKGEIPKDIIPEGW